MVKKAKTKQKTKKTCKKSETEILNKSEMFLRKLQAILKKPCGKSRDSNDSDHFIQETFYTRNMKQSSSKRDPAFLHTNIREDTMRDNYTCYRCKHFLEIPRNLSSQPFSDRASTFVEQCKDDLNFIRAIVWLKSSIACVSQISIKQLQQIFNEQWNTASEYNHYEDECIDVEQLRSSTDKDLSRIKTRNTSTPLNSSDVLCVTPQRTIRGLYARSEDPRSKSLNSMSANDLNESVESLILGNSGNHYIATREKKKDARYIIPETDVESILNDDLDTFYDIPEHQPSFEYEKDTKCLVQTASRNGVEQINKKIDNKYRKSHAADVLSERKYILPTKNQSSDTMFKYNCNGESDECFTSTKNNSDNNVAYSANKLEFDGSPRNFVITPRDVSQMSNVCNEYFEFLLDNNSPWQANNTAAENSNEDSAYSTSHADIFNCNTAADAGSITGNKRVPDSEYYKLQPCQKKTMYEKEKDSSSISEMLAFVDCNPRSFTVTEKDISQISDVHDDENCEFQETRDIFNSENEWMSDTNSKNSENDATVVRSIIGNKRKNIKHCSELHSRNDKMITCQKVTSPSIIQKAVIPHNNIEHCDSNLQASNNKRMSCEKEVSSARIQESKEYKSKRATSEDPSEKENETEDDMISANWLNFTMDSLRMERVILASIKVILSMLCDQKMVEEYMIRQQRRNARNYWKGSLEEEAINAVLNISDIFTIEEKPNICIKIIMIKIVKALNEIIIRGPLYKIYCTQTSVWIYRLQIILEFCNSLPICIKVTDYLITKLKSLQSLLINVRKMKKDWVCIKQLYLVFYALNITLRKYCTIISNDQRSRPAEKVIPHVADLWKAHYIDKELKHNDLDLHTAEKQWLNTLENSAATFVNFGFAKFAKKSFSLIHVLISRSSTKIT